MQPGSSLLAALRASAGEMEALESKLEAAMVQGLQAGMQEVLSQATPLLEHAEEEIAFARNRVKKQASQA